LQRSLNGEEIDSLSKEMRALVAYIKWTGKNVDKNTKADEVKTKEVPFLERAADSSKGAMTYVTKCKSCHGEHGEGLKNPDSIGYLYPPLWGEHSYAVSAGMYRLTKLASFVKFNMPLGATFKNPQLSNEEAWDVAAYINSKPPPKKIFANDWPVLSTKPVDYPFGPYTDKFSEEEHKYGPFLAIELAKKK
jgi:thiosulfate dehydrogenase